MTPAQELQDSGPDAEGAGRTSFSVHLANFEGPFDLLLQLISKHKLDITEVALSKVTDEFIAHIKAAGDRWDLEQTSSFLVVAATLLDLKAARLLPSGEVDDPEDLALLEARDLLFARLLQYRAFKIVSGWIAEVLSEQGRRHPRQVGMEQHFTQLMPEVTIGVSPERFAELAAKAMTPKQADVVSLAHLHAPTVNVRDEAVILVDRLRRSGALTFRALTADATDRVVVVCRFLALLELFREAAVAFEQLTPLGELTVRWTGSAEGDLTISDEFDAPPKPAADEAADEGAGPDADDEPAQPDQDQEGDRD
ncbi:segregation and condensation protein A [Microlunatus parietis]|uniref:Segregation and condensation protein A n=1 Tax=Microlunatus parietis TaxID=682979 RepID=A0A7Y9I3N3_9ACTN|nr:segregation and condensation protein A [Microlunatus parietis]